MADAIKAEYSVNPKMIEGSGGIFDVHVDGKQVWSKHETGRFPEHQEVLNKIKSLSGQAR